MLLLRVSESNLTSFMMAVARLYRERVPITVQDLHTTETVKLRAGAAPLMALAHHYKVSIRGVPDENISSDPRFADLVKAARDDANDIRYGKSAVFPFERAAIAASMLHIVKAENVFGDLVEALRNNSKFTELMGANITPAIATLVGKSVIKKLEASANSTMLSDDGDPSLYTELDHLTLRHSAARGVIGVFELGSLVALTKILVEEYRIN